MSNVSVFNTFSMYFNILLQYTFSTCVFNQGSQSSRQSMAKPDKCEQTSPLLTKRNFAFQFLDFNY